MGTIFIHFHPHDLFAAEVIAGALVDCGDVILRPHGPCDLISAHPERLGVDWHVALWTSDSTLLPTMRHLVHELARLRGPLLVLTCEGDFAPPEVRSEQQLPLFARDVDWRTYRARLRARLRYSSSTYPRQERVDGLVRAARNVDQSINALFASRFVLPGFILFCVFIWALR